jgi:hypothetical protein
MKVLEEGFVFDVEKSGETARTCCCTSFKRWRSGKIWASFRLGTGKDTADGNCRVAESADEGKNWKIVTERFDPTVDGVSGEIRVAELAELDEGTVAAFLLWVDRSGGKKLYDGQTDSVLPTKLVMTTTGDGGRTWSAYRKLETENLLGPSLSGPTVRIPGRGWLVPFENFQPGLGIHSANALFSPDGYSFEQVVTVAQDPANVVYFFDERQAYCPKTERLVAMFWTYNRKTEKDLDIHMAWGDPKTLVWETPFSVGFLGQVCQPIPLPDGRLAAFYVHRHPPGSLRLVISEDGGRSWDREGELVVYACDGVKQKGLNGESDYAQYWEDMLTTWTFGHPTGVVLPDGTLLLGYYAGPTGTCLSVRWARVEL